jgi:choice-of-anchor A domain-containing protein
MLGAFGPSASAADLGSEALSFVLLSTGGKVIMDKNSQAGLGGNGSDQGVVGGTSALLKKDSQAVNDIVTNPGKIVLKRNAEAFGCITDGAQVKLARGAKCEDIIDTSGESPELGVLGDAIIGAVAFADLAAAETPDQTLPAIVVPRKGSVTITDTQTGLNIVSVPSVTLKRNALLKFSGAPGDTVILVIDHDLNWDADAFMTTGGVTDVIFVVSGKIVSMGRSSQLVGTILAPNASCALGVDAQVSGAVFCGKKITLGVNSQVIYNPTTITIP